MKSKTLTQTKRARSLPRCSMKKWNESGKLTRTRYQAYLLLASEEACVPV